jgi:peptidyl-prolyl cis-trans isomerase SurA
MRKTLGTCIAALLAGSLAAAPFAGAQTGQQRPPQPQRTGQAIEGIVALVNDEVISQSDLRNRARLMLLSFPQQPDEQVLAEVQERALQGLIEEKIQLKEFKKLTQEDGISDEEVDRDLARLAQRNQMTTQQFLAGIQAAGVNPQTLRDQVRAEIAWSALIRGRFARQIRVSELRVDEMMDRFRDSVDEPQYRIAEIYLYAPDTGSRVNAMNTARTLSEQIAQGASFDAVAQQFSAAPSASAGGDLGWLSQADLRPEIAAAIKDVTAPAILPPLESEGGVYLIGYLGKREAADLNNVMMDLKQLTASGDDAAAKLERIRTSARTCEAAATAATGAEGVTATDMKAVAVPEMSENFRTALEPLQQGGSTPVLDLTPDSKTVLFVCARSIAGADMPTRDQIRDQLFDTEISMLADRYLRDLKREATIVVR